MYLVPKLLLSLASYALVLGCSSSDASPHEASDAGTGDVAADSSGDSCASGSWCTSGGDATPESGGPPPEGGVYCTADPNDQFGCYGGRLCCATNETCYDPQTDPNFCN